DQPKPTRKPRKPKGAPILERPLPDWIADAVAHGRVSLSAELAEKIDRLPTDPGCYLFHDRKGRIIYVGKAVNLRNRVRSYFTRTGDTRSFVSLLGGLLGDVETVVTSTEKEALLLENTLVKQHQPRFNVKLRDDKNFLSLRLDPQGVSPTG